MEEKVSDPTAAEPAAEQPAASEPEHKQVLQIHLLGSSALRQATLKTEINDDIKKLAEIMVDTMHHVRGVGLAAPQVGVPARLFVMISQKENRVLKLANPTINSIEGEQEIEEGCLSQPGLAVKMKRPQIVNLNAYDLDSDQNVIIEATDLEAAIVSHEMDHLNGKLICDYLSRLKRDMYQKKLKKKLRLHDRIEKAKIIAAKKDHRDHPHFTEPKR